MRIIGSFNPKMSSMSVSDGLPESNRRDIDARQVLLMDCTRVSIHIARE